MPPQGPDGQRGDKTLRRPIQGCQGQSLDRYLDARARLSTLFRPSWARRFGVLHANDTSRGRSRGEQTLQGLLDAGRHLLSTKRRPYMPAIFAVRRTTSKRLSSAMTWPVSFFLLWAITWRPASDLPRSTSAAWILTVRAPSGLVRGFWSSRPAGRTIRLGTADK